MCINLIIFNITYILDDEDSLEEPMMPTYPRIFNIGDLVWGQIRGFPSWPGKLINFTEVKGNHKSEDGKVRSR